MNNGINILISNISNISIIFTLSLLYSFIAKSVFPANRMRAAATGFLYGMMTVIPLANPFYSNLYSALDGVAMIICTAGVIGGIWGGVISILIAVLYKLTIGGEELILAIGIAITSGILGMLYTYLRKRKDFLAKPGYVFMLAFLVYLVSTVLLFILKVPNDALFLKNTLLQTLIFFPIATFFLITILDNLENVFVSQHDMQKLNNRLRAANKLAIMGHWEFDVLKDKLFWTDEVFSIFEITDRNFVPTYEKFLAFIHPDDRDRVNKAYLDSMNTKHPHHITHRIITAFKNEKYVEERCENIFDSKGRCVYSIGTVRETTESVKRERLIKNLFIQTINAIATTLEGHDEYTKFHQLRVANLSVLVAMRLGFDNNRIIGLYLAAMLHDIGKVAIPSELLNKVTPLTKEEFDKIKSHPKKGYEIFKDVAYPWPIRKVILQHHERLDGSGYPYGLKSDEIIEEAKIIAVCDSYEAMLNNRPYRKALGLDFALRELKAGMGKTYDEKITSILIDIVVSEHINIEETPIEFQKILEEFLNGY